MAASHPCGDTASPGDSPADLSASSNTTYSTVCSFSFISTATCTRRPGVAMILWGQRG